MKRLPTYLFSILILTSATWLTESDLAKTTIIVTETGDITINNYLINRPITHLTLDSLFNKHSRIKQRNRDFPRIFIYDKIGINAATEPCVFKSDKPIRSISVFYKNPFNTSPRKKYFGKLSILGYVITDNTKFSDLIKNEDIIKHLIHYEASKNDVFTDKTTIELRIDSTYVNFWFNASKSDSSLISVDIDPFKKYVN